MSTRSLEASASCALMLLLAMACVVIAQQNQTGVDVDIVVVIGVDGMPALCTMNTSLPSLELMKAEGSWAKAARCMAPTVSGPNWAGILRGNPPWVTGVLKNDRGDVLPAMFNSTNTSLFERVQQSNRSMALASFYTWCEIRWLMTSNSESPSFLHVCEDDDADTYYDALQFVNDMAPSMSAANSSLDGYMLFVHFDELDAAGHDDDWFSDSFLDYARVIDSYVGGIVTAVNSTLAALNKTAVVIVTSDHGGTGDEHSDPSSPLVLNIPFLMWSNKPELLGQNFQFVEPTVTNMDVYATVLDLLGLYDESVDPFMFASRPLRSAFRFPQPLDHRVANATLLEPFQSILQF